MRTPDVTPGGLVILCTILLVTLTGTAGAAARCGGGVVCKCGDTVTADYELPDDLGPCPGHGLLVKSGVHLDCRDHSLTGRVDAGEHYGIFLNGKPGAEVVGATVKRCRVSGFSRGIRLRAAQGNVIVGNVSTANGDFKTHAGYGIDLSGASRSNILQGNTVRGNADEGIHIGRGSHQNRLSENIVNDNYRENLYLLAADGGTFLRNRLGGGGSNSLYLKDSSANHFEGNTFVDKTARVIGDSLENRFVDNTFAGAGLHIQYYRQTPARRPAHTLVKGGIIKGPADCLRFTSSSGNVVVDTILADCPTQVQSESPAAPSENTVAGTTVSRVSLDDGSRLHVGWSVAIHVEDLTGVALPGARIEAKDAAGATAFTAVTDLSGNVPATILIVATRGASTTAEKTPHTFTVTKDGYRPHVRTVPLTENATLTVRLEPG